MTTILLTIRFALQADALAYPTGAEDLFRLRPVKVIPFYEKTTQPSYLGMRRLVVLWLNTNTGVNLLKDVSRTEDF